MKNSEWSLIFFTLLVQIAIGWILTFGILQQTFFDNYNLSRGISGKLALIILPVIFVAVLISFFHLGTPEKAVYALSNITNSWLSREIFCVIIFGIFTLLFSLSYSNMRFLSQLRFPFLILASLSGIALIFSMSKLYMLETVPAWNSYSTPVSFYLSSIILGSISLVLVLFFLTRTEPSSIFNSTADQYYFRIVFMIILALIMIETFIWIFNVYSMAEGNIASRESYNIIIQSNLILFVGRIILNLAVCALLGYLIFLLGKGQFNLNVFGILSVTVILSEIVGRYLFYSMYARLGV